MWWDDNLVGGVEEDNVVGGVEKDNVAIQSGYLPTCSRGKKGTIKFV